MAFWQWSKTPASNATADPSVNWAEGMSPSAVNDSARAGNARLAEWRDDISATITTGGTSTAYTVASNQVFDTLAHMNGAMIAFVPHTTCGATVTFNVDGLGAKPLRSSPSVEIGAGTLIQGSPYVATYNNSDAAWYLRGFYGSAFALPIGGLMPYLGATPPNSNFALLNGQQISRTTYATLFSLISTTFGVGNGTTTFNIPDLRGRAIFGIDAMGGAGALGLISAAGGNFDATVLGATGGAQNHTLTQAELSVDLGTATTVVTMSDVANSVIGGGGGATGFSGGGTHATTNLGATAATTITNALGGHAHPIMPPAMVLPYILRVI